MAEHLGFIGVGRMGAPMAARLIDAGHKVTIFDTSRAATASLVARGAVAAASARELAAAVETVIVSLPTPDIVREVALGENGIASGNRVKTVIDLSTTGPRVTQAIAAGPQDKGNPPASSPASPRRS